MRVSGREIAEFVAKRNGFSFDVFIGPRRNRQLARPRQISMYVMRQVCTHLSLPAIGQLLGGRDHTTVLHGVRTIERLMISSPLVFREVTLTMDHFAEREFVPLSPDEMMYAAQIDAASKHLAALLISRRYLRQAAA